VERRRPATLWALLVLLTGEFLLVAALAVTLVIDLVALPATSLASGIALTVLVVIAAVWLGAILVGTWRWRSWVRSAAIVWQVLQFAVGVGALQGAFAQPVWGWPLVATAVVAVVLLVSKPVAEALRPAR
jgi:hypothetical protein